MIIFSKASINCIQIEQSKLSHANKIALNNCMQESELKTDMNLERFLMHEESTSVRFIWNHTPQQRGQLVKNPIPAAVHYTPLNISIVKGLSEEPFTCYYCYAMFTHHSRIDFISLKVQCCYCLQISSIPAGLINLIKKQTSPSGLNHQSFGQFSKSNQCQTISYVSTMKVSQYEQDTHFHEHSDYQEQHLSQFNPRNMKKQDNCYILLIDRCLQKQQFQALKNSLIQNIINLPAASTANIALVSYSKNIYIHDLQPKHKKINTVVCLSGLKNYSLDDVHRLFAINPQSMLNQQYYQAIHSRFFAKISNQQSKKNLIAKIQGILIDQNKFADQKRHERPLRAIGACLKIAITIDKILGSNARIMLFSGGPCTFGPGLIIKPNYCQTMKKFKDYYVDSAQNSFNKFYSELGLLCLSQRVIIDYFLMSIQQSGLVGMKQLVRRSGGDLVMHQQFKGRVFSLSLTQYFLQKELKEQNLTNAYIVVRTSPQIKLNGALGKLISLQTKLKRSNSLENERIKIIGQGNTNKWYIGSLSQNDTFTFIYQKSSESTDNQNYYFQFQTIYRHKGLKFHRITTVQRYWTQKLPLAISCFDQEAAAVLLAKLAAYKFTQQQKNSVRQWLDQLLVKFCNVFGTFCRQIQQSFMLPQTMKMLPQFIYHLRKASFARNYGLSPDQMYYQIHNIYRQNITNCLIAIQPAILKYSLQDSQAQPVSLQFGQLKPQVILLLDTYYNVILWYGKNVKSWREEEYHKKPEYSHLKELFEMPQKDMAAIFDCRFPVPNFYETHENHSKQRFLKSRLASFKGQQSDLQTDQVDLKGFTQSLIRAVVNGQSRTQIEIQNGKKQQTKGIVARFFS